MKRLKCCQFSNKKNYKTLKHSRDIILKGVLISYSDSFKWQNINFLLFLLFKKILHLTKYSTLFHFGTQTNFMSDLLMHISH